MAIEATKESCLLTLSHLFEMKEEQLSYLKMLLNHECYEVRYATLKALRKRGGYVGSFFNVNLFEIFFCVEKILLKYFF